MKKILFALFVLLAVGLQSCKKDDGATDPTPSIPAVSNPTTSAFGAFPMPNVSAAGGVIGAVNLTTVVSGFQLDTKYGFGSFIKSGTTNQFVYGGSLKFATTTVDTMMTAAGPIYLIPNASNPLASLTIPFDGATNTTITVVGNAGNGVTGFTDAMAMPAKSLLTAPASGATISHSTDLALTWNATGGGDSVMVFAMDFAGHYVAKSGLGNTGSATIASGDLSAFSAGSGYVMLVKYRYHLKDSGGKTYAIIGETVHNLPVTWN